MEFVLRYQGRLPATNRRNNRREEKHAIRLELGLQLADLWQTEPILRRHDFSEPGKEPIRARYHPQRRIAESVFSGAELPEGTMHYINVVGEHEFLPLIVRTGHLVCNLDILFLRDGQAGNVVRQGGDIDNRLKVLFDALRMPHKEDEIGSAGSPKGSPVHCLLEDDSLINDFRVRSGRLLADPKAPDRTTDDVALTITVNTRPLVVTWDNIGF